MYGHRTRAAMAFPALCAALALAGCGTDAAGGEPPSTGAPTHTTTPSKPPPPPITPGEHRWLKAVRHYDTRLVASIGKTSVVTSGSLSRSRDFDDSCKAVLRRAGSPGRYQPVQPMVHRACAMLHRAATQLRQALSTGVISGAIIDGDVVAFSKSLNGAYSKEGAATNVLAHALVKADRITKRFGPAT
ncbi:MAG TPA: hypothetical protein VM712_08235 [Gaiellales bacterium]|jgi:hypothetical protein|nr:hypothetical protein [Gaiellales bacterium]